MKKNGLHFFNVKINPILIQIVFFGTINADIIIERIKLAQNLKGMKKIVIIVGLISALAATILATTKFSNFSIIPIIIAFISGLILLFLSKKEQSKIKPIQYIFLLVIISLGLTIYKSVNTTSEIEETEPLEQTDQEIQDKPKAIIDSAIIDEKI